MSTTRKALREGYGVCRATFAGWLRQAGIQHNRRKLTPAEVSRVKKHLDAPEEPVKGENAAINS